VPALRLFASVLNADFGRLAEQVGQAEAAGVDAIHVDVMDGRFVPNISLGFVIVEAIRRSTRLPLDLHLMIDQPERYLAEFAALGAQTVTVHAEAVRHLHRAIAEIHRLGPRAGVALVPATPLSAVEELCAELQQLLIMTIDPGFGGQPLIPAMIDKVRRARRLLGRRGSRAALQVDGGVKVDNLAALARAGADTFVVGTGIFGHPEGIGTGVSSLRAVLDALGPNRSG
jgi:ribulose-phosphate 3-epimerase